MAYDNTIPILREQKNEIVEQGTTLDSIDSKLGSQTTSINQVTMIDIIRQQERTNEQILSTLKEICKSIKAIGNIL